MDHLLTIGAFAKATRLTPKALRLYDAHPGDRYLLCSDGLFAVVPDARIRELLGAHSTPEEAVHALVAAANDAGGPAPACASSGRRVHPDDVGLRTGTFMAEDTTGPPTAPLFSRRDRAVIAAAAISMLLVQMDWFALTLMLPVIARDFGEPTTDLQWLVSGYMLALGALMIIGGRLADIHGRRRVLIVGLTGFGAVSVVCSAAQNEAWLVAGRVVQGASAALVFPVAVAVVTAYFRDDRQGRAVGTVLAFSAVGTALGPFVGGAFAEHVSWRAAFLLNVPLCAVAALLMLRFVAETRDEQAGRGLDLPGAVAVTAGLTAVMLAVDQGSRWGWTSPATVAVLVAGAALLVTFFAVERGAAEPLLDLTLLRNRPFVTVTLAGSLSNVVYCLVAVLSALYLQQARGLSPLDAGLVFLALSVGAGGASYWSGHLARRWRPEAVMSAGMLLSAAGLLLLTWSRPLPLYTAVFAVVGIGVGLGWALTNTATQSYVPAGRLAAASGLVLTSLVLLGAVAVTVAATVLEALSGSAATAASDGPAIEWVLRAAAVLAAAGALSLVPLVRTHRHDDREGSGRTAGGGPPA
ncbi:MFS transporter [Streptomyces sp. NPDC047706]|uniref:MFS transporter n=1 Tax=Streptomyces sp. NPDC047706 TaxID=3365486 RepID=UPI0037127ED0